MHRVYYKKQNKQNTNWAKIWGRYQISYRSLMVDFDVWYNASVDLLLYCWCSVALMLMLLHFFLYLDKTNKKLWSHQGRSHVFLWCSANTREAAAILVINIWSWAVSLLHSVLKEAEILPQTVIRNTQANDCCLKGTGADDLASFMWRRWKKGGLTSENLSPAIICTPSDGSC